MKCIHLWPFPSPSLRAWPGAQSRELDGAGRSGGVGQVQWNTGKTHRKASSSGCINGILRDHCAVTLVLFTKREPPAWRPSAGFGFQRTLTLNSTAPSPPKQTHFYPTNLLKCQEKKQLFQMFRMLHRLSPSRCWKKRREKFQVWKTWVKEEPQNYIKLLLIGKPARFSNSTRQISESPTAFRQSLWAFGRSLLLFVKCWTPCRRCCAGSCRRCRPYLLPCQVVALWWCWILIPKHDLCSFCNCLVLNLVLLFGITSRCLSSTQLQVNQPNWMKQYY